MSSNEAMVSRNRDLRLQHEASHRAQTAGIRRPGGVAVCRPLCVHPIALALLFALVLSSPVEALYKRGVPRSLGALVLLAVALGVIIAAGALLWKPAQYWYAEAAADHPVRQTQVCTGCENCRAGGRHRSVRDQHRWRRTGPFRGCQRSARGARSRCGGAMARLFSVHLWMRP